MTELRFYLVSSIIVGVLLLPGFLTGVIASLNNKLSWYFAEHPWRTFLTSSIGYSVGIFLIENIDFKVTGWLLIVCFGVPAILSAIQGFRILCHRSLQQLLVVLALISVLSALGISPETQKYATTVMSRLASNLIVIVLFVLWYIKVADYTEQKMRLKFRLTDSGG